MFPPVPWTGFVRSAASVIVLIFTAAVSFAEQSVPALPAMPEAAASFGAAILDGYVYVYGGHLTGTHSYYDEGISGKFHRLNLTQPGAKWEELPGGPPLQGLAMAAHGGKVYRIGGMQARNKQGEKSNNHSVAWAAAFDTKTMKWSDLPDMPQTRSSHDAVVVDDRIVVIGGWSNKGKAADAPFHETALALDLTQPAKWSTIPQPFKRRALSLANLDGKAAVVGGLTWENEIDKSVNLFDPRSDRWTTAAPIPGPMLNGFSPAACVLAGRLYACGSDGKIYRLSAKQDSWDEVATVATKRSAHRMLPVGDSQLLVLGGTAKNATIASLELIEPAKGRPAVVAKGDPAKQQFCPIMTTSPIDEDCRDVDYKGVKIKICCATCAKRFLAEPEAYLDPAILPQIKDLQLPVRKIDQAYCPVFTDRRVSSRDPSAEWNGRRIFFFNETAKAKFLATPDEYRLP